MPRSKESQHFLRVRLGRLASQRCKATFRAQDALEDAHNCYLSGRVVLSRPSSVLERENGNRQNLRLRKTRSASLDKPVFLREHEQHLQVFEDPSKVIAFRRKLLLSRRHLFSISLE